MEMKTILTSRGRVGKCPPRRRALLREMFLQVVKGRYCIVVQFSPYKGYCYRSIRYLGADRLDLLTIVAPPEFSMKRIQLGQPSADGTAKHLAAMECSIFSSLPSLMAHCGVTRYDDGTPRQPGWVSIQTRGAAWIVTVKDPDAGAKLNATGNTLDDALALAELLLSSEEAPWEVDPFLQGQQKKKKKAS